MKNKRMQLLTQVVALMLHDGAKPVVIRIETDVSEVARWAEAMGGKVVERDGRVSVTAYTLGLARIEVGTK